MALEYNLEVETNLSSTELLKSLSTTSNFVWGQGDRVKFLLGSGLTVTAIQQEGWSQSIIEETFSFKPSVTVLFRIESDSDYYLTRRIMLQTSIKIMQLFSGDLVLLYNGETIVLQRLRNQLLLNQDFWTWEESDLDQIKLPYELRSLPSPLL